MQMIMMIIQNSFVLCIVVLLFLSSAFCLSNEYQNQCPFLKSFNNVCHSGKINGILFEPKNQLIFSYGDNSELFLWNLLKNEYVRVIKNQISQIIAIKVNKQDEYSLSYLSDDGQLFNINYLSLVETDYNLSNLQSKGKRKILDEISDFHPCLSILYFRVSSSEIEIYDYEKDEVLQIMQFSQDDSIEGIIMSNDCSNQEMLSDYLWTSNGSFRAINYIYEGNGLIQIILLEGVSQLQISQVITNSVSDTPYFLYISQSNTIENIQVITSPSISIQYQSFTFTTQPIHFVMIESRNECLFWLSLDSVQIFSISSFSIIQTIQIKPIHNQIIQIIQLDTKLQYAILDYKGRIYLYNIPDQSRSYWTDLDFEPVRSKRLTSDTILLLESKSQYIIAYTKNRTEREYLIIYNIKNHSLYWLSCNQNNFDNIKITPQLDYANSRGIMIDETMRYFIIYQNSQINLLDQQSYQLLMNIEIEQDNYFQQVAVWLEKGYIVFITGDNKLVVQDIYGGQIKKQIDLDLTIISDIQFISLSNKSNCFISYSDSKVYKFQIISTLDISNGADIDIGESYVELFVQNKNIIISECFDFIDSLTAYYLCSCIDNNGDQNSLVLVELDMLTVVVNFNVIISPDKIFLRQNKILVYSRDSDALIINLQLQPYGMQVDTQKKYRKTYDQESEIFIIYDEDQSYYLALVDTDFMILNSSLEIISSEQLKNDTLMHNYKSFTVFNRKIVILKKYYVLYNRLCIMIIDRIQFHRVSFLELEEISHIKSLHISEKRILVSTYDQYLNVFQTPNLVNYVEKMMMVVEQIVFNKETNQYIYLDQLGQSHVIYFNDYIIKTQLKKLQSVNLFYYDSTTQQFLIQSQNTTSNNNLKRINIFSKQLKDQQDSFFEFDLQKYNISDFTPLNFDNFLLLNIEDDNSLVCTFKWQQNNNSNKNDTIKYQHSLLSFNYSSKQLQSIQLTPHMSEIIFLLKGMSNQVITVSYNNSIKIWNAHTLQLEKEIPKQNSKINDIIFDEQENMLIVCLQKQQLIFYDVGTLQIIAQYSKFKKNCEKVAIGLFRQNLIATEQGGNVIVFNYKTRLPIQYLDVAASMFNVLYYYPLYYKDEYLHFLNSTITGQVTPKEQSKRIILGSSQGKVFVYGWKKLDLSKTNNPQQYLKEIQQGISEKYEFSLQYSFGLASGIKLIEIDKDLDLIIACSKESLIIAKFSDGSEIQRIDIIESLDYQILNNSSNTNICQAIVIIHEYMQLYLHTNQRIIVYNLAYIISGPYIYKLDKNMQKNLQLIKPLNSLLSTYISHSQESQLSVIDQNTHNIFIIFQGFDSCILQDFFIFFDNIILIKCSQFKMLLFKYNESQFILETLPSSIILQKEIKNIQNIIQSKYYPHLFYILNAPYQLIALRFLKDNNVNPFEVYLENISLIIEQQNQIKDIILISRLLTLIVYFDGNFQICNPLFTFCSPLIKNDFQSFINGHSNYSQNNNLLFLYSYTGEINLYEMSYSQSYFSQTGVSFEESNECQALDNIDIPNFNSESNYSLDYVQALDYFIQNEFSTLFPNRTMQADELDFLSYKLNFTFTLIKQNKATSCKLYGIYVFERINKFITLSFSEGLIFLWDLQNFKILSQIQIPQLTFNIHVKACVSLNTFILSSCMKISLYSYDDQLSTFKLTNFFTTIDDLIQQPQTNFLNYFSDYQIILGENSYKIINLNQGSKTKKKKILIQEITIESPVIVSLQLRTNIPNNSRAILFVFGFSKFEIFWHIINLSEMNDCVLELNNFSLNEVQDELEFIERNQQISSYKIKSYSVILTTSDALSILPNIPTFKYSSTSSITIIGNQLQALQINQSVSPIIIQQNWQQLSIQNLEFNYSLNPDIQLQFIGQAQNKYNQLFFKNFDFKQFTRSTLIEINNYKSVTIEQINLNDQSFSNQTLLKIKSCDNISISDIRLSKVTSNTFIFIQVQGSFTSNQFQNFSLNNFTITDSSLVNTDLYFLQFGEFANISNISAIQVDGQNSRIFQMQGIHYSEIEFSNFTQNSGISFLNSSRYITINYEIYSQFKVYYSYIQLRNVSISENTIDSSINNILSFHEQNISISSMTLNEIQGQKPPSPSLLSIPYYNPATTTRVLQQQNENQIQQEDDLQMMTVIKAKEIIRMEIEYASVSEIRNTNHIIQSIGAQLIIIKNSSFIQNGNEDVTNGLIYLERSSIQLDTISFSDNVSNKCTNLLWNNQSDDDNDDSDVNQISSITNCIFRDNYATNFGGALCFAYTDNLHIIKTSFLNNTAQIAGAIFYIPQDSNLSLKNYNITDSMDNVIFTQNKADLFGTNYASGISFMKAVNLPFDGQYYVIEDFRSGDSLHALKIQLYDEEERVILNDNNQSLNFKLRPIKQQNIKIINQSDFEYSYSASGQSLSVLTNNKMILFGTPGQDGYLYYSSDYIDNSQNKLLSADQQTVLQIKIKFRNCKQGEIQRLEYDDSLSGIKYYSCFQCPEGKYSLIDPDYDPKVVKMCQLCPVDKATFCEQDIIQIKSGFWRENNKTDLIVFCMNNPDACLGQDQCLEGHIGPLCEDCDIQGILYGKKYTRINNEVFSCIKCDNNFAQISIMFLLQVAITGYIVWSIKKGLDRSKQIVMADLMRKLALVSLGRSSQINSTSAFIKIIAHYVQVISSLKYYHPQYPSFGLLYVDYIGDPIDKATFAFDCILIDFSYLKIPFEYLIIIWSQLYQIIYLLIYLVVYYCLIKMKRVEYRQYAIRNAIIFFILFIQNSIVSQLVSVLTCRQIGHKSYIRFSISKECYTPNFYSYSFKLVVPLLLLWALIIPAVGFYLMWRIRKKLFTFFNTLNYGLIYLEYKPKLFYWEFIRIIKKTILIFIVNFFYQSIYYQGIFTLLLVLTYTQILKNLAPYKEQYFNKLEQKSSFIQIVFFFLVLIQEGMEIQKQSFLSWIIVIMNLIFLIYLIFLCIQHQTTLQQVYLFIYKIPCLRKCVEKKIPLQPRIFSSQQLWRSLSIYVRDFIDRRKLDKNAKFYVQHLQIGNYQDSYRVSQLRTSQQLKNIQRQSSQTSIQLAEKREIDSKQEFSSKFNKLLLNEIVTESKVITRFDAISEENQEEDHEIQSEKNIDQIPQQQNQILIPDFYPNQTKMMIDQTSKEMRTEVLDTQGDDKILQTQQSLIFKDIKQESFLNNASQPSIISPQSMIDNSNSSQNLYRLLFHQSQNTKDEEEEIGFKYEKQQQSAIPRTFKTKQNGNKFKHDQNEQNPNQSEEVKVIASLFTPRINENQNQPQIQTARVSFIEKMKRTKTFRSAQKQ